jgi:hypothetical protein
MKSSALTITILAENTAQGMGLLVEHGLSLWIADPTERRLPVVVPLHGGRDDGAIACGLRCPLPSLQRWYESRGLTGASLCRVALDAVASETHTRVLVAMKRIEATLLALVFVVGVLIAPAIHRAHCLEGHGSHDAAQCSICQLASTPALTAVSQIAPITSIVPQSPISLPELLSPCTVVSHPGQARAPPVA